MYINGLVQDCSNSIANANALELLQSSTKPSIWCDLTCQGPFANNMAADDLLMQGARTSAAMVLNYVLNYLEPEKNDCILHHFSMLTQCGLAKP